MAKKNIRTSMMELAKKKGCSGDLEAKSHAYPNLIFLNLDPFLMAQ